MSGGEARVDWINNWENHITGRNRLARFSLVVFAVLTVLLFFPYARSPGTVVSDPGDPLLLIWVMEWVERAIVHSPLKLLSAPMFHPFPDTLAYTDPVVPHALVALPLHVLGVGPVGAYNAVYLGSIVATGVLCTILFLDLCGSPVSALLGAMVATYPAIRLFHLAHIALQVTTFWPLVLLLVHRLVRRPDLPGSIGLSLALAGAALGSLYYGLFLAILLPPFALSLWLLTRPRSWAALRGLVAGGTLSGALLIPFARVYARAAEHLAQKRTPSGFSDLSDYVGISRFADMSAWIPQIVVRHSSPQWVGGGGALLLPVIAMGIGSVVIRDRIVRNEMRPLPTWVRAALPYVIIGCLSIALTVGPVFRWHGRALLGNPFAFLFSLPGIRDFQRAGFPVAIAGGAVVAIVLGEIFRRCPPPLYGLALAWVLLSTLIPAFSSTLPVYRPPTEKMLGSVYRWIAEQPEPMVLYEAPLPPRGELEPLVYLWTSVHHRKRLVHGFSGYLPLTDDALRAEATRLGRADYFRALSELGATHLLVHTGELAALPSGLAALATLRETWSEDLVARFGGDEVYRIPSERVQHPYRVDQPSRSPEAQTGGWVDPVSGSPPGEGQCVEIGPSVPPLLLYAGASKGVSALTFVAQSELGSMDDALLVESSDDLRTWRPLPHRPLLSASLEAYVHAPTPVLFAHVMLVGGGGPFLRLSSRRDLRLRLCGTRLDTTSNRAVETVPKASVRLGASANADQLVFAVDGNVSTRWHSGEKQRGGEWVDVDLGTPRKLVEVDLLLGTADYDFGRRLGVQCLDSGKQQRVDLGGETLPFARPRAMQIIPTSPTQACQRIRVLQSGTSPDNYWSIAEIQILAVRD